MLTKTRTLSLAFAALTLLAPPALAADHDQVAELFASSYAHEAKGDHPGALNDVLQILRADEDLYVAVLRAGWLYYAQGRHADSVAMYERAERLAPEALEPKLGLTLPLMASGRWAKAEVVTAEVLQMAPRNYTARSRFGWIAFNQGRYKVAETHYSAALADFPSDLEMMMGLGATFARQGRKVDARALYERVLLVNKDHLSAKAALQAL